MQTKELPLETAQKEVTAGAANPNGHQSNGPLKTHRFKSVPQAPLTPQGARSFDRYSVVNATAVESSLPCGCKAYESVFTYRRWKAQGFQVQRGS